MGNCNVKPKDVVDAIQVSRDIISKIICVEKDDDEIQSLRILLEMLYNIDKVDKHNQKLILSLVENKLKNVEKTQNP